jgi:hypothetical protein
LQAFIGCCPNLAQTRLPKLALQVLRNAPSIYFLFCAAAQIPEGQRLAMATADSMQFTEIPDGQSNEVLIRVGNVQFLHRKTVSKQRSKQRRTGRQSKSVRAQSMYFCTVCPAYVQQKKCRLVNHANKHDRGGSDDDKDQDQDAESEDDANSVFHVLASCSSVFRTMPLPSTLLNLRIRLHKQCSPSQCRLPQALLLN